MLLASTNSLTVEFFLNAKPNENTSWAYYFCDGDVSLEAERTNMINVSKTGRMRTGTSMSRGVSGVSFIIRGLVDADAGAVRESVDLVPFGATCLRTTCFPAAR